MNYKDKTCEDTVQFKSINVGDWFKWQKHIYLKIAPFDAFCVYDHTITIFELTTCVKKIKAALEEEPNIVKFEEIAIGEFFFVNGIKHLKTSKDHAFSFHEKACVRITSFCTICNITPTFTLEIKNDQSKLVS